MKINSLESFGTVDGPGVRFVAFLQGCPLRCLYCHNPDTWALNADGVQEMTPQQLFDEVWKYRNFIKKGGVTLSGGDPLMQAKEAAEFFAICKREGFHTALDTAGTIWNEDVEQLLSVTDLVLLDIKSLDREQFKEITKSDKLDATLRFLEELQRRNIKCWLRYVLLPRYTDNDELIERLRLLSKRYSVVENVEILPYHAMAEPKYDNLGIDYPLRGTEPPSEERVREVRLAIQRP